MGKTQEQKIQEFIKKNNLNDVPKNRETIEWLYARRHEQYLHLFMIIAVGFLVLLMILNELM